MGYTTVDLHRVAEDDLVRVLEEAHRASAPVRRAKAKPARAKRKGK